MSAFAIVALPTSGLQRSDAYTQTDGGRERLPKNRPQPMVLLCFLALAFGLSDRFSIATRKPVSYATYRSGFRKVKSTDVEYLAWNSHSP